MSDVPCEEQMHTKAHGVCLLVVFYTLLYCLVIFKNIFVVFKYLILYIISYWQGCRYDTRMGPEIRDLAFFKMSINLNYNMITCTICLTYLWMCE